jgi:tetratricopeptide (TPR) repeat protein
LIYIKMTKYDRALSCARRALKTDPKDPLAARLAARALAMLNRHSEALLKINAAMKVANKLENKMRAKLLVESAFSSIHSDSPKTIRVGLADLELALKLTGAKDALSIRRNIVRGSFLLGLRISEKEGTGWPEMERAYRERTLLPDRERAIVAAGAALVAISAGKVRLAEKMVKALRDELDHEALVPGLRRAGHGLFAAYSAYFSEHLNTKLRAVRSIERLASSALSPSGEMLKNLAGSGYEQIGYQSFKRGRSEQARIHLLRASRLRQVTSIKMRHNIAVATYYSGTRKEGIAALEAISNRVPLALCNLGVDLEIKGSMIKAYNFFKQCLAKKVPFPGLTEIVDIKRQIFGP